MRTFPLAQKLGPLDAPGPGEAMRKPDRSPGRVSTWRPWFTPNLATNRLPWLAMRREAVQDMWLRRTDTKVGGGNSTKFWACFTQDSLLCGILGVFPQGSS